MKRYAFDATRGEMFEIASGAWVSVDDARAAVERLMAAPTRTEAEQRVLDAMADVPEETLRRSVANVTHAPEHSRAPCVAELARRGLKP